MLSESGCGEFPQHQIVCERRFSARASQESSVADNDVIRCGACPVLCYITEGRTGACDRYGNLAGQLVRLDPHIVLDRAVSRGDSVVPFLERCPAWVGILVGEPVTCFPTIGPGSTY